jgi:hypothetical protein
MGARLPQSAVESKRQPSDQAHRSDHHPLPLGG